MKQKKMYAKTIMQVQKFDFGALAECTKDLLMELEGNLDEKKDDYVEVVIKVIRETPNGQCENQKPCYVSCRDI